MPEKAKYFTPIPFLRMYRDVHPLLIAGDKIMAEKKKETKAEPKEQTFKYNGKEYTIMEESDTSYKLTDGIIHFWVKKDVK